MMKICFVGLGSIGIRHANNMYSLLSVKNNIPIDIHAFRSGEGRKIEGLTPILSKETYSIDDLDCDYDIIFITNPTAKHYETLKSLVKKGRYVFLEKPAFESSNYDLGFLNYFDKSRIYVACPLRYTSVIENIKNIIQTEKIFSVRVICSTYLPEWRPNVDYRNTYSANKSMGGGVDIDLIHEMDYVTYLFGIPKNIICKKDKYSNLELDCVDYATYILEYEDKTITIHLDYFGRYPQRKIELYTENDLIVGDLIEHNIVYKVTNKLIDFAEHRNDYQIKELDVFLSIVNGNSKNENNIEHAINVLRLAEGRDF